MTRVSSSTPEERPSCWNTILCFYSFPHLLRPDQHDPLPSQKFLAPTFHQPPSSSVPTPTRPASRSTSVSTSPATASSPGP